MKKEMPSIEEQNEAIWYVLERPLVRPDTNYKKATAYVLLFIFVNMGIAAILYQLIHQLGILFFLPESWYDLYTEHHIILFLTIVFIQFFISGMLVLKSALIGAIRLYQHYAPEHIRRKCLCKPTCSEYAILVIKKYGVIHGMLKIYIRLFKKCRGNMYMIDEP